MSTAPAFPVVAGQEIRRAFNNFWSRLALTFVVAYTIVQIALVGVRFRPHDMENYLLTIDQLRWASLAVAGIMAGPALLEDQRRGALELYFSRAVTHTDYILGKVLAVTAVSTLALLIPGLLYYVMGFVLIEEQPADWNSIPFGIVLYSLMWGLMVSGLGLGFSAVGRSSRGATLLLLGSFALLEIFVGNLLEGITRNGDLQILSPFAALSRQSEWLFSTASDYTFPYWWGLVEWAILVVVGWGLVATFRPRVRGD